MALRLPGPALLLLCTGMTRAVEPANPPVLSVRLVRPDRQWAAVNALFRGSRAPNPAAALAAWRYADRDAGLGKSTEAVISLFNPAMVREVKVFDGSRFELRLAPETGRSRWTALIPKDDGSLGALVTAIALTDGTSDLAIEGRTVLRLGPPGAPVAFNLPNTLILASDLESLKLADRSQRNGPPTDLEGCDIRFDPAGLRGVRTLNAVRASEAMDAMGCTNANGRIAIVDQTLDFSLTTTLNAEPSHHPTIDPQWVGIIPKERVAAAASVAIDTGPDSIAATFAVLDRIEKADPTHAGVAPSRTRLNLLAASLKVFPDQDLWPLLKGLTAVALTDDQGNISGGLLAIHAKDNSSAMALFDRVLPRVSKAFLGDEIQETRPDGIRSPGMYAGRPIHACRRESSVLLAWGTGSMAAGIEAWNHPEQSAGPGLRASWGSTPPQRFGAFWPGRLGELVPQGSALANSLRDAPPILWDGRIVGKTLQDRVQWAELSGVVKRWLDALPLVNPPDK